MQRLKRVLKWWPALLVLILVAAAGVVFVPKWLSTSASETSDLTQVFTAQRGNLVAAISPTGEVYAPRQVDLSFDVYKAELIELNVTAGQKVKAGDVLARIDSTALERAVIQAEADLTVAQDNLDKAQNPYTELDLTQAKVAVDQAEVALAEAKDNLEKAQDPYTELDLTQAKLAVAQAEAALEEAKENLKKVQNSATGLDLTEARVAVDQAKTKLEEAQDNLASVKAGPTKAQLASAEAALATAEENYKTLLAKPDPETVEQAKFKLDQAKNSLWSAQMSRDSTCGASARGDAPKTSCDNANIQVANAEFSVRLAEISYQEAQAPATATEIANAAAQVQQAEENLEKLRNSPTSLELAQAEAQVTQAEYNLAKAQENLAELEAGPDPLELTKAETQVSQAEYNLAKAQEALAEIEAGPDPSEVTRAEAQVSQAEYNLAKAQDTLAEIEAGPDPKEVEVAQAKVVSTQAALEEAQAALKAATMVAPFDGTVISVGAEKGDLVSSSTIVVTLADLSNLRVLAIVDETDISNVEVGQEVEATFDAFPGLSFLGQVLEVPLQGKLSQNVLTYEVPVSLEGTENVALKTGMTANLEIVVGRRENALLVPAMAVQQGEEGNVVMVQDTPQGAAVATPVQVGLSDGTYVEIVSGLIEGDRVLVKYEATQEQFPGFGGGGGGIMMEMRP
ncbi:MAG: efflux RND transporter periplasmic adaptor subunit [Anaerolineae bacterium]